MHFGDAFIGVGLFGGGYGDPLESGPEAGATGRDPKSGG
jgi:hypothetical protein